MDRSFLHIGFVFDGPPRVADLAPVFNSVAGADWMRYSNSSWVVWTERTPDQWYEIVRHHIAANEQVLIVGLDMNLRSGWLPRSLWDWIDARRGVQRQYPETILSQALRLPDKS